MPSGWDVKWIQAPELRVNINTCFTPQRKTPGGADESNPVMNWESMKEEAKQGIVNQRRKMKNMRPEFRTSKVRQEQELSNFVMYENHPEKKMLKIQMPRPAL